MPRFCGRNTAAAALVVMWAAGAVHGASTPAAPSPHPDAATADQTVTAEERLKRNRVTPEAAAGDAEFQKDQARGLSGDAEAAFRVGLMYKRGSNGVPQDDKRMLQWLLHASQLSHGAASYQLYLYYLEQRLDRDAVYFENRALEQGYTPPPRLNPRRG